MLLSILLFFTGLLPADSIPYKPAAEYQMKLDYGFREAVRREPHSSEVAYNSVPQKSGPLPYLIIDFTILKLDPAEVKVRVSNNAKKNTVVRKISVGTLLKVDIGYMEDVKDRVEPYFYQIEFMDKDKNTVKIITIDIKQDGTFFLNGERRGIF